MKPMGFIPASIVGVVIVILAGGWIGQVDSSFDYQGQLKVGGQPANGVYDLIFTLYDEYDTPIGMPNEFYNQTVENGLFSVVLYFGDRVFGNETRYLQIQVRPHGDEMPFVTLSPRQQLRATPYASTSLSTVGVDGHSLDTPSGAPLDVVYVDDNARVGVGTVTPTEKLDVAGGVKMLSLKLGNSATPGHVLTTDAYGVGTWQPASGSGSCYWLRDGEDNIFYGDGYVGVNMGSMFPPAYPLHVLGTVRADSLKIGDVATPGDVLTADEYGNATWQTPAGGTSVWGVDNDDNILYNGGNVGINLPRFITPSYPLHVGGTAMMGGFRLGSSATAGHVLTADEDGFGTWQRASGGASVWTVLDTGISHPGFVGIGTTSPDCSLHVASDALETMKAVNPSTSGSTYAILGECESTGGKAVAGLALANSGSAAGVFGRAYSSNGRGVYGFNANGGYAVYGEAGSTSQGWGGYFYGRGYFAGRLGIGTTSPQEMLHVNGMARMNGFRLGTSTTSGYVLTANSSGVGTWQPASGGGDFDLPVDETVVVNGDPALSITNNGSGIGTYAIRAQIANSGVEESAAGYFRAENGGFAIQAANPTGGAIYASSGGTAIRGYSTGSGAASFSSSHETGYGVRGFATSSGSSSENRGGWFEGNGSNARGVYAKAIGSYGRAIQAEATGGEGVGVYATAPWTAIEGRSAHYAGKFYGQLAVYEYGTYHQVFKVNDNTGETIVEVLKIEGGADLSEPFDVAEEQISAEPGMIVSIDPDHIGKLMVSQSAYDHKVAGVISGAGGIKPGLVMGQSGTIAHGEHPVALTGRVWTLCDATTLAIEPGDLLTSSTTPGHAMKATDGSRMQGAVIGKAMSRLEAGSKGLVLVLVNLQ